MHMEILCIFNEICNTKNRYMNDKKREQFSHKLKVSKPNITLNP